MARKRVQLLIEESTLAVLTYAAASVKQSIGQFIVSAAREVATAPPPRKTIEERLDDLESRASALENRLDDVQGYTMD